MDKSRIKDLAQLERLINDPSKSSVSRRGADKARKNIIEQIKDKKLQLMRERLIKASEASDERAEWKISNQIKDYMNEARVAKYT